MAENNENETTSEEEKNFIKNITDAIEKLKAAREDLVRRFEEARDSADEDTATIKILAGQAAELIGESTAKAKAAYEAAGGIDGISQTTVKKAAELGASAKLLQETIASSKAFQSAVDGVKTGATKVSKTTFFTNIAEEAKKLKDIAGQTYTETYAAKKTANEAKKADAQSADA